MAADNRSAQSGTRNSVKAAPAADHARRPEASQQPPEAGPERQGRARAQRRAPLPEPPAIAARYYVEARGAERRYYDDVEGKALAITADEGRISTDREDRRTIRDMLILAEARGWRTLDVSGRVAFRRQAWIEASARGLEARGYRPTNRDRQGADRRVSERTPAARRPAGESPATLSRHVADVRAATAELSEDGRLILSALAEKIDRQMGRQSAEVKAELKAFAATALVTKERAEGPAMLSPAQRRLATAPDRAHRAPEPAHDRRAEPPQPRLSRSR